MPHFEIHGDDENGITIKWGAYTKTYDLRNVRDTTRLDTTYFGYWSTDTTRRHPYSLELDLFLRPEILDATPTVYGEGTWLH